MKSNKPIVIFGAGGHASVLIEILALNQCKVLAIVDPKVEGGETHYSFPVISFDEFLSTYKPGDIDLVNGIGIMPNTSSRQDLAIKLRDLEYKFKTVIHPAATIAMNVEIDEGAQIMAGVVIQPNVRIGKDTIINTSCSIDHDCKIGSNCHIAPGVVLSGGVVISDSCFIGTGSVIINDISIGKGVVTAGGSTIYENLPNDTKLIQKK